MLPSSRCQFAVMVNCIFASSSIRQPNIKQPTPSTGPQVFAGLDLSTVRWTFQQLREAITSDHPYRFLVHDRDSIYTQALDTSIANLRLRVLKTPYRSPKANSLCERLIGSLRRECLDWAIPLSEGHLRNLLKMWSTYYNQGRPHMALGPEAYPMILQRGVPAPLRPRRHPLSASPAVVAKSVLNGLHHDYRLAPCST